MAAVLPVTGPVVPPGGEELREALIDALCAFDEEIGAGIPPEETADAVLPTVLAVAEEHAKRRAAEVVARVKAVPTYTLTNDDEPLGTVVLADDVLNALAPENARPE